MHHIFLLMLLDVINHFEFPHGEELLVSARQIGPIVAALKETGSSARISPVEFKSPGSQSE